ncbi:BEL1-like homeodomain protein 9 isoform X2 [Carya illinoinensis]|uniref:BEL1-like homeodomain protein 9 isoform X2 n=1 Tax=Carya illinoinensis TaxID=32201 RepID=UPI001C722130|nr:BEL1-like homeodomain protein 9 isoform X2 [Carya illinoinensis]
MEMSSFRPDLHVAQQSRRDKLRVPQGSNPTLRLEDFPDNLEQLPFNLRLNPDLVQVRNVNNASLLYDPTVYSPEMVNISMKSNVISMQRDAMVHQEIDAAQIGRPIVAEDAPFANSSLPMSSNFNPLSKASIEPQNCGDWKSLGSQQNCDWMVSYASGSVGSESNTPSPMFFGEVSNISAYPKYMKPSYNEFQDVRSPLKNPCSEISGQDGQKHSREMPFTSVVYQNSFQDGFLSASNRTHGIEMASHVQQNVRDTARGTWAEGVNELALLPTYGNQSDVLCFNDSSAWTNRPVGNCHQWGGQLGFPVKKSDGELRNIVSDSNPQGLSLSLSSNSTSKLPVAQFGEGCGSEDLHSRATVSKDPQDLKAMKSGYFCAVAKPSIISKGCGKPLEDIVGISSNTYRNTGPLGPFTGYATILKSSKFLKPAQQLLDELCGTSGSKITKTCELSVRMSGEVRSSGDALNATETEVGPIGNNSGASSSTFYRSNDINGEGRVASSSCESLWPEYQQKKAKLIYMQEEVCRRYKQYHQQMQMVVSSFESVAGLSSATPYVSLALRSVSRHFRFLKNAITDQLKYIRKATGEDLSSPTTGTSNCKGDANTPKLRYLDQSLQRHKYGGGNVGYLETQQHVWRPQRGLPERSVAILRAWLFEHFLHPYPTDTDKHMLATQTGLSRNQVSNWFINARVRVWKPMVEEIHMLETKGLADANQNPSKNDKNSAVEGTGSALSTGRGRSAEQWNQEKRSRIDCQIPTSMDGSSMGFMPYQRNGLESSGPGAVSLTLGLRHGAENAQHQQPQLQQQEDHLIRREFGGMIHEFVG